LAVLTVTCLGAVAAIAGPASAQRLRSPSSSLVLNTPTITCGVSPQVGLSWTDRASVGAAYQVMSKLTSARQTAWSAGAPLGGVFTTSVSASNNTSFDFAIRATTSVTRDSNVVTIGVNCAPVDGTPPGVPAITSAAAASCSQANLAWTAATDVGGSGLAAYNVYRAGVLVHRVNAPATTYSDSGLAALTNYSYAVSAIDGAGNQSAKSAPVNVTTPPCPNTPPVANAGADQTALTLTSVGFNGGASRDPDGLIASYAWNFGDGASGTGVAPSHTYTAAGIYTLSLTVTDNLGATGSDTATVTITNRPPTANAGPDQIGTVGVPVNFGGSGSDADGVIASYAWNFGDGARASGASVAHAYASAGTYTATLTVTDNNGATASDTAAVTIGTAANKPPVASAGADQSAQTLVALTFNGSGSSDPDGTIASYAWNFGDGATASGVSVTHAFSSSGTYTVTLTVTDNQGAIGTDTAVATIMNRPPVANAGPDVTAATLSVVTFNGSGSSDPDGTIASYAWNFGDGATASGVSVTHAFSSSGTYAVTLTVTDNKGSTATDTAVATITNRPPVANAGPDQSATAGIPVSFSGSGSSDPDGSIASYAWNFGDSTTGSGVTATHTYPNAGTYTATLTVTDDKGATASDRATITVTSAAGATWAKKWGATDTESVASIVTDPSGNIYVIGLLRESVTIDGTALTNKGASDILLAKFSPTGALVWARDLGGASDESARSIAYDGNGNVDIVGQFSGTTNLGGANLVANGVQDMFVAQFNAATGAHQWSKSFGGATSDSAYGVATDTAGDLYVTGYFQGTANFGGANLSTPFTTDNDLFLAKFTVAGAPLWSKNFPNDANDEGYGVAVDSQGSVVVIGMLFNSINFSGAPLGSVGTLSAPGSQTDVVVAKFTSSGAYSWSLQVGSSTANESPRSIVFDSAGDVGLTMTGSVPINFGGGSVGGFGSGDVIIAKYSGAAGAYMWADRWGGTGDDNTLGLTVDAQNNFYIAGTTPSPSMVMGSTTITSVAGSLTGYEAKVSSTGALVWARQLGGGAAGGLGSQTIAISNGAPVVGGYFFGTETIAGTTLTSAGGNDAFLMRDDP
jgi:PKD repeat protein